MMQAKSKLQFFLGLIDLEDFLKEPPFCFTVEKRASGCRFVKYDPETCCVFIEDVQTATGKVVFQHSAGRSVKVRTLRDYTHLRKRLTSKLIFLLVSACENNAALSGKKAEKKSKVLKQFIVVINGSNSIIKWEMERGLDQTISSVAGESYTVKIDVKDALQRWMDQEKFAITLGHQRFKPVWRDTWFVLKYHSDALFDFPFWFGFSKRKFTIDGKISHLTIKDKQERFAVEELFDACFCPAR
ncbi:mesenteric estrogen-dependent adipogenesis protein-like isoform X2 [Acipenser ruthenus]|uniref:mesenteric estrogen-dependent adipogenesis protein-like isoform X2 n=1 Tax=Acipenser ruthenus TaxID=7906 RepID=UPI002740AB64|nr:mesenteric estrogen-dependent adipogenesis protein-like isoform X2 [Acipenser ruthenus]